MTECIAECVGVFIYTYLGISATAAFTVTTAAKVQGFGSLLTIGLAYGFGVVFAILVAAPISGGHLSPGYTIAFAVFKGFPARKVPQYIISQILGAFIACLVIYASYGHDLQGVASAIVAAGEPAAVFTPSGPAGVFALFPNPGQPLKICFANEFFANVFLSIVVFTVLDISNAFVTPVAAPFLIGFAYAAGVWCFAAESLALNTARDLGGRMVAAIFFGPAAFTASPGYTAIAALVNLPANLIGAMFYTLFLSDTAKLQAAAAALGLAAGQPAQNGTVNGNGAMHDSEKRTIEHIE